jgi:hypothetical protein
MYRRVDANGQRMPRGCNYPPIALSNTPEFQAVNSRSCNATIAIMQWSEIFDSIVDAMRSLKTAKPETPEQGQLIKDAKAGLWRALNAAADGRSKAETARDQTNEQLRVMEAEYRTANPPPDNERYSGMGVEEFNKRFPERGE